MAFKHLRDHFGGDTVKNMSENDPLVRIAQSLERLAPAPIPKTNFESANGFIWRSQGWFEPVGKVNRVDLALLKGIDHTKKQLVENTQRFANGFSANNTLLWGARGMGKSSLVKAAHAHVNLALERPLKLAEIHREDIETLPDLMSIVRTNGDHRVIVYCDDLSFDGDDASYKSLKAALDGGIEGRPDNMLFYATSNRRHLLPRDMMENERSTAINPSEAVQEKVSLSDRFGLWLGFHNCNQDEYLAMVFGYVEHFELNILQDDARAQAIEWSVTRGSRSGRVAWQFVQDLAGRLGVKI